MVEIVVAIIAALSSIAAAIISGINIKQRKNYEKLSAFKTTEFRLGMDMQAASIELSDVIAIAVTGGHTNGNVEEARRRAQESKRKYYDFINSVAAETLAT